MCTRPRRSPRGRTARRADPRPACFPSQDQWRRGRSARVAAMAAGEVTDERGNSDDDQCPDKHHHHGHAEPAARAPATAAVVPHHADHLPSAGGQACPTSSMRRRGYPGPTHHPPAGRLGAPSAVRPPPADRWPMSSSPPDDQRAPDGHIQGHSATVQQCNRRSCGPMRTADRSFPWSAAVSWQSRSSAPTPGIRSKRGAGSPPATPRRCGGVDSASAVAGPLWPGLTSPGPLPLPPPPPASPAPHSWTARSPASHAAPSNASGNVLGCGSGQHRDMREDRSITG